MKDPNLVEQDDGNTASFTFAHFRAEGDQERFDVLPAKVCAGRMREDCLQSLSMGAVHVSMVPKYSTLICVEGFRRMTMQQYVGLRLMDGQQKSIGLSSRQQHHAAAQGSITISPEN